MTPLIQDTQKDPAEFINEVIQRFAQEVSERLQRIK
jgi:hypothetical protein